MKIKYYILAIMFLFLSKNIFAPLEGGMLHEGSLVKERMHEESENDPQSSLRSDSARVSVHQEGGSGRISDQPEGPVMPSASDASLSVQRGNETTTVAGSGDSRDADDGAFASADPLNNIDGGVVLTPAGSTSVPVTQRNWTEKVGRWLTKTFGKTEAQIPVLSQELIEARKQADTLNQNPLNRNSIKLRLLQDKITRLNGKLTTLKNQLSSDLDNRINAVIAQQTNVVILKEVIKIDPDFMQRKTDFIASLSGDNQLLTRVQSDYNVMMLRVKQVDIIITSLKNEVSRVSEESKTPNNYDSVLTSYQAQKTKMLNVENNTQEVTMIDLQIAILEALKAQFKRVKVTS